MFTKYDENKGPELSEYKTFICFVNQFRKFDHPSPMLSITRGRRRPRRCRVLYSRGAQRQLKRNRIKHFVLLLILPTHMR